MSRDLETDLRNYGLEVEYAGSGGEYDEVELYRVSYPDEQDIPAELMRDVRNVDNYEDGRLSIRGLESLLESLDSLPDGWKAGDAIELPPYVMSPWQVEELVKTLKSLTSEQRNEILSSVKD